MKRGAIALLVIAVASFTSCGRLRYAYAPVTTTSTEVEGHAAAVVPIDGTNGEIRVASLGVSEKPFRALFVRFVVKNDSAEEWTFDPAEQRVDLVERGAQVRRSAMATTGEKPALVRIPARTAGGEDLLFPIGERDEGDLSRFDVIWTVRLGERVVTGHAAFARKLTTREPAPAAYDPEGVVPYPVTDRPDSLFPRDPSAP